MATVTGSPLSGSTNGRPIPVVATGTPGTLIHTVGGAGFDELYIWASNVTASPATLTIEYGGTTDPGDHLVKAYAVGANSLPIPIALGQRLAGGVLVRAFSATGSALNITGFYNRVQ